MRAFALALLFATVGLPVHAATIVLDFEEEAGFDGITPGRGLYNEGFVSSECACVHLYGIGSSGDPFDPPQDLADLRLRVQDFGDHTDGQAILVGHEGALLVMVFLIPVVGVSLDFGNDLPADAVSPLDDATLTGFDTEGAILAHSVITPNRDLFVNQTISIASENAIARAVFDFRQLGENEPEDFIVDNLVLTTVPEPGTLGLMLLGAAAAMARRTRR